MPSLSLRHMHTHFLCAVAPTLACHTCKHAHPTDSFYSIQGNKSLLWTQSSRAQHIMAGKLRQQQEVDAVGHTVSLARNKRAVTVRAQPTLGFLCSPESKHEDWHYLLSWRISVNLIKIILTKQAQELTSLKHPSEASAKAAF